MDKNSRKILLFLILFFHFFINSIANGQTIQPIRWEKNADKKDIISNTLVWVDSTKSKGLEDAQYALKNQQYIPLSSLRMASKFKRGLYNYWLYFEIQNTNTDTLKLVFNADIGASYYLYAFQNEILIQKYFNRKSNISQPYWVVEELSYIVLKIAPQKTYKYFVQSHIRLCINEKLQPVLKTPVAILAEVPNLEINYFIYSATLSVILMFFLFAIAQYFQTRYIAFLYYGIYLFLLFIYFLDYFEKNVFFDIGQLFMYFNITPSLYMSIFIAYSAFCNELLREKDGKSPLDFIFKVVLKLGLSYIIFDSILQYINIFWSWEFSYYFRILLNPIPLWAFYKLYFVKNKVKYFIYTGTSVILCSSLIAITIAYFNPEARIRGVELAVAFVHIGIALEIVIFALALGYKMKRLEIERNQAAVESAIYERNRIAAEMHDDLGHELLKIRLISEKMKQQLMNGTAQSVELIEKLSEQSKKSIEKTGDIIWSLNSQFDNLSDLIPYLRRYTFEFLEMKGVKVDFDIKNQRQDIFITGEKRKNITLITKEVLNNIVKHANATQVKIELDIDNKNVFHLSIHDNGIGIKLDKIENTSNGIKNIQKRIEKVNGNVLFQNGFGTKVTFDVPL